MPYCSVWMDKLGDDALLLAEGDATLLNGHPGLVLNHPIQTGVEPLLLVKWLATGRGETLDRCAEICEVLVKWIIPKLDLLTSPADLVRSYETGSPSLGVLQHHSFLRIAAAYVQLGRRSDGHQLIKERFTGLGPRRQFASALRWFESN